MSSTGSIRLLESFNLNHLYIEPETAKRERHRHASVLAQIEGVSCFRNEMKLLFRLLNLMINNKPSQ